MCWCVRMRQLEFLCINCFPASHLKLQLRYDRTVGGNKFRYALIWAWLLFNSYIFFYWFFVVYMCRSWLWLLTTMLIHPPTTNKHTHTDTQTRQIPRQTPPQPPFNHPHIYYARFAAKAFSLRRRKLFLSFKSSL